MPLSRISAMNSSVSSIRAKVELAAAGEIGQEARLLLVGAEQRDRLHADRLVNAHDHRQRRVDLREHLGHAAVAGLRQALPAVLLVHVQAAEPGLAEGGDHLVADPAVLLGLARVDQLGRDVAQPCDQGADLVLLFGVRLRIGEDEVLVDLAEEERLREAADRGRGFHQAGAGARFPSTSSGLRGGGPT
jgi:hypothetical protein